MALNSTYLAIGLIYMYILRLWIVTDSSDNRMIQSTSISRKRKMVQL